MIFTFCFNKLYLILAHFPRLERDAKLGALEERADALQDGCAQFEKQASAMKNKFWLENLKAMIAAGVVGVIVLGFFYWNYMATPAPPPYPYYPPPPPPPPPQISGPVHSTDLPDITDAGDEAGNTGDIVGNFGDAGDSGDAGE